MESANAGNSFKKSSGEKERPGRTEGGAEGPKAHEGYFSFVTVDGILR